MSSKKTASEYLRDYFGVENASEWPAIMEEYALYCAAEALKGCAKHPEAAMVCPRCQGARARGLRVWQPTPEQRAKWGAMGGRAVGNGKGWPRGKKRPKRPTPPVEGPSIVP